MATLPLFFDSGGAVTSLPPDNTFVDGLLETMRCQDGGSIPLWHLHRARLLRCGWIDAPELAALEQTLSRAAASNPAHSAKLRLRVGYVAGCLHWDISILPLEPVPEEGVSLFVCATRLPVRKTANPGCKYLQRTRYNCAKDELPADHPNCDGLLLDSAGRVIESLRCNLLAWHDGRWLTPDLRRCGVKGVMRDWLSTRIDLEEADLDLDGVCRAQEVVLCNSVRGVMPVRELIGYCRWSPGEATLRLQQLIAEELW